MRNRSEAFPEGAVLGDGRFELRERLGGGGFGDVYAAWDRQIELEVAVKVLRRRRDRDAVRQFKNEFRGLSRLTHPNLVKLHELHLDGKTWFFVMELIRGQDFLEYVRPPDPSGSPAQPGFFTTASTVGPRKSSVRPSERPRLLEAFVDARRLNSALLQVTEGLAALHQFGKLHCDIKPSNVLVDGDGRVAVCDFGLVEQPSTPERFVAPSKVQGTPEYMSPEQARGAPLTEASDWYSVGVMLYRALTGVLPFTGTAGTIMSEKQWKEPLPPSQLDPRVSEAHERLCIGLLRADSGVRFGLAELHAILGEEPRGSGRAPTQSSSTTEGAGATVSIDEDRGSRLRHSAHPRTAGFFVGRDHEVAALRSALASSRNAAVCATVHGSSGMGKSTLVEEFLRDVRRRSDVVVLEGRCYDQESVPYKAFDVVIDELAQWITEQDPSELESLLPDDLGGLTELFPVLSGIDMIDQRTADRSRPMDAHELRRDAFKSLKRLLAAIAKRHPVVISIDDLQWGDLDSAALLNELIAGPGAPHIFFVTAFRSEERKSSQCLEAFFESTVPTLDVPLSPLTSAEAASLLRCYGITPDRAASGRLHREVQGNPFFLTELALALEQGHGGLEEGLFATVDDVLRARVGDLDPGSMALLQTIAVSGRPIAQDVLRRTERGEADLLASLTHLRASRLIRIREEKTRSFIECYHARIRQTVLETLSSEALEKAHGQIALAMEEVGSTDPEKLASHYYAAKVTDKARHYARIAAHEARRSMAFGSAARMTEMLLDLCPPKDPSRFRLLVELGSARAHLGRTIDAADAFLSAAEERGTESLDLKRRAGELLLMGGDVSRGRKVMQQVLGSVGLALPRSPAEAQKDAFRQRLRLFIRPVTFDAEETAFCLEGDRRWLSICWAAARGLAATDVIASIAFNVRHLMGAVQARDCDRTAWSLALDGAHLALGGYHRRTRVEKRLEQALVMKARSNEPYTDGMVGVAGGTALFLLGDFRRGRDRLAQAERVLRERCTGADWELSTAQIFQQWAHFYLGEILALVEQVPRLQHEAEERGDRYAAAGFRLGAVNAWWLALDKPDDARREIDNAKAQWSHQQFDLQHYWELVARQHVDLYTGRYEDAWNRVEVAWPLLQSSLQLNVQNIRVQARFLRALAGLGAAFERPERAADLLVSVARDARSLERERTPWVRPFGIIIRSGIAAFRSHRALAQRLARQAAAGFDDAGMSMHAAAARIRASQLGADPSIRSLAVAVIEREGVAAPDRWVRLFAPPVG